MAVSRHKDDCPFKDLVMPPIKTKDDSQLEARVGRVEVTVDTLSRDIQSIGRTIHEMSQSFTDFKDSVVTRIGAANRPNWPIIFSIVTMLFMLLGMGGAFIGFIMSGHAQSIAELRITDTTIHDKILNSEYERGKTEILRSNIAKDIENLDNKTQKYLTLIYDNLDSKLNIQNNELIDFKTWRLEHISETCKIIGGLDTKFSILDKLESRQYQDRINRSINESPK